MVLEKLTLALRNFNYYLYGDNQKEKLAEDF